MGSDTWFSRFHTLERRLTRYRIDSSFWFVGMAVVCCGVSWMDDHHQNREKLPSTEKDQKVEEVIVDDNNIEEDNSSSISTGQAESATPLNSNANNQNRMANFAFSSTGGQALSNTEQIIVESATTVNANAVVECPTLGQNTSRETSSTIRVSDTSTTATPLFSADMIKASVKAAVDTVSGQNMHPHQQQQGSGQAELDQTTAGMLGSNTIPSPPPGKPVNGKAGSKKRSPPPVQPGQSTGRWTNQEHEAFLEGLKVYGREWKKVANHIPTRTSAQVRSHAQKYFAKLTRDEALSITQQDIQSEGAASAAAAIADSGSIPPSVQRNVERIIANPSAVQQEVEAKLRALRERYRQLQRCLEEQQTSERPPQHERSLSDRVAEMVVEDDENDNGISNDSSAGDMTGDMEGAGNGSAINKNGKIGENGVSEQHRKRRRGDTTTGDDGSISSATISSLGNEELIALSVLGGALPSGNRNPGLSHVALNGAAAPPVAGVQNAQQSATSSSSLASENERGDDAGYSSTSSTDSTSSAKRKKGSSKDSNR